MAFREIPTPPRALSALAGFVRQRLGEVSGAMTDAVTGVLAPPRQGAQLATVEQDAVAAEVTVAGLARQFAVAVVGAAAPLAPTSYARARLLRQMHASGLLTDDEVRRTATLIDAGELPPALLEDPDAIVIDVE